MPKLTVEFSEGTNEILMELAARRSTTKAEIIRWALALYKYTQDELSKGDKRNLSITEGDKVLKDIIIR